MTAYERHIRNLRDLNISSIIKVAKVLLPLQYDTCPWTFPGLDHGTAILDSETACNAYLAAYGLMHQKKLLRALDESEFPYNDLKVGFELFDWGCGQGIGTMAVIEKLRDKGMLGYLRKVTLEEPSDMTRSRALINVRQALDDLDVEVVETSRLLPSDSFDNSNAITSIDVEQPCALHIFSNILDIEQISLKGVSQMIVSSGQKHIVLCIGPDNINVSRLEAFANCFNPDKVRFFTRFRKQDFDCHPNGRYYGCVIISFSFSLTNAQSVLCQNSNFAPILPPASYTDDSQGFPMNFFGNWRFIKTYTIDEFKKKMNVEKIHIKINPKTGKKFFSFGSNGTGMISKKFDKNLGDICVALVCPKGEEPCGEQYAGFARHRDKTNCSWVLYNRVETYDEVF